MERQFYIEKNIPYLFFFRWKLFRNTLLLLSCFFSINSNAQTIGTVTVSGTPACAGTIVNISFVVTNGTGSANHFAGNTTYRIYYTVGGGYVHYADFNSNVTPAGDGASATVQVAGAIPSNAITSSAYRISIGSINPSFDGSHGANASSTFSVNAKPKIDYTKVFASSCHGGTDGSITVTPSGGVSPYSYSWTGPGGYTANTSQISNLSLGDYTVVVTDANNCKASVPGITIKQAAAVKVGVLKKTDPGCSLNDGTISVFRIGGVYDGINDIQYKLDGDATKPYQTAKDFDGLPVGTYTVTVQDSKGCTGVSSAINLVQAPALAFTHNGYNTNVSACGNGSDGSATVTVVGGVAPYHYMLDGVEKNVTSLLTYTIRDLQPNVPYNVSVIDSKGCSISKNVTLTQESAPVAMINYKDNETCIGANNGFITSWQSGGVPGYQYSNNGGVTFQSSYRFLNLSPATYNVVVKDSKGCVSAPVAVAINPGTQNCVAGRIENRSSTGISQNNAELTYGNSVVESGLSSFLTVQSYPNPFSSDFTVSVKGKTQTKVLLIVTDILGRRLSQIQGETNRQYKVGNGLNRGIYFVQAIVNGNTHTIKVVKQ